MIVYQLYSNLSYLWFYPRFHLLTLMAPTSPDNLRKSRNLSKTIWHAITNGINKTIMEKFIKKVSQLPLYILPFFQRIKTPMAMTTTNGISSRVVMTAGDMPWALWLATVWGFSFSSGAASGCWCCFSDGSWIFCTAATGDWAGILGNGFRLACTNVSVSKTKEGLNKQKKLILITDFVECLTVMKTGEIWLTFLYLVVSPIQSITEVYNNILSSLLQELQWYDHKEHIVPLSLKG